jgi:Holliday junction resolvase RusA-like endonuclease
MISFTVYGNPKALKRHRTYTRDRKGNALKFARQVDPSAADKADFLAQAMKHKPDVPFDCPLRVDCHFYFPRPKSHYGHKKGEVYVKLSAPQGHTGRPDRDNLDKFVLDALSGIFWRDDSIVCYGNISKQYSEIPRTEIKIKVLE